MFDRLLSGDLPRSRVLTLLLALIFVFLVLAPWPIQIPALRLGGITLLPSIGLGSSQTIATCAKILVFVVLVASYDLLLGYTGIVSFAHTMFFGIGGYGIGLALDRWGPTWGAALGGLVLALVIGLALALLIGFVSLRVRAIFYAMVTLAVASAFAVLAAQWSELTGGEDGRSFKLPVLLRPQTELFDLPFTGQHFTGRMLTYYLIFVASLALFLAALRVVNSPFGRVLQAIRENEFRAEALGFNVVYYRTVGNCLAAVLAILAGALYAFWLGYTGPDTTLSFEVMIDILLMTVIGGMGTLYGAIVGATIFLLAQTYLQPLMKIGAAATGKLPVLPLLLDPDRWLLWLGLFFILSVYFFPTGIVGKLRGTSDTHA